MPRPPKAAPTSPTGSASTEAAPAVEVGKSTTNCRCSGERLIAIVLVASAVAGVALACGIFGVPVSLTDTIAVRLDDGPLPPGPGPGPNPSPFDDLADQVAAEARNVQSRNRSRECTAMADAIERFLDRQSAESLEALFADLRRSISPAIPPRSADAWRTFNLRVDELLADEFDAGRLVSVADGVAALQAVAAGLRDAAGRF